MKLAFILCTISILTSLVFNECQKSSPSEPFQSVTDAAHVVAGYDPIISPNGKQLAFLRNQQIFVCDTNGNNVNQISNWKIDLGSPQWSPDGSKIGFVLLNSGDDYDTKLMSIDITTKQIAQLSTSDTLYYGLAPTYFWAWSPDGGKIAMLTYSSNVKIIRADGSGERISQYPATEFSWSPDGTQLVCADKITYDTSFVYIVQANQDTMRRISSRVYAYSVKWSSNSNAIFYYIRNDGLKCFDLNSNEEIKTYGVTDNYQISPDGINIASYYIDIPTNPDGHASESIFNLNTLTNVTTTLVSSNGIVNYTWAKSSKEIFYDFNGDIYKKEVPP
jgi:Tol biopolymer transport system component